ncbi:MAG: sigma-70 family RNA polymerase sigma factor [Clostridia bacterium]|nr:sigma-70 family RNA polymerase sigma factor [Clostridia bacterium]
MLPFLLNKKVGDALKAIKKGDNSGFDVLYDCIGRTVYLTAYSVLGNEPDAADTVQDVFLKLYRNADRYDPDAEASAAAYVLRIARNCALDRLRKRKDYVDIDTAELAASESGAGSDEAAGRLGAELHGPADRRHEGGERAEIQGYRGGARYVGRRREKEISAGNSENQRNRTGWNE